MTAASWKKWISKSIVAVIVVGAVAAGLSFHSRRSSPPSTEGGVTATLHLDTFVLNLADPEQRAYLRVGIDLGLQREPGKGENSPPVAQVRDTILGVLAQSRVEDLLSAAGKQKLKDDLLRALQERVPALGVQEIYASSQVDKRKVGRLALAIQVAFQELGVFPASTTQIPLDVDEPMPFGTLQAIQNARHNTELGRITSSPQGALRGAAEESDLDTLQNELQDALHHEIKLHQVAMHRETEGLVVSLREFGFFDSGSTIKPESLAALDRISSILAIRTYKLRIEGHTDNIPIHTAKMESNWELSTARATELVRMLIVRDRFAPERLSAAGYAEFHPIASNQTERGRAQNRRVDIVILRSPEAQKAAAVPPPEAPR